MGVNADAGGRVELFGPVDRAAEWQTGEERLKDWAEAGDVSGLVDGRIDEVSVEDEYPLHWEVVEEEEDTKEGGRLGDEYWEQGLTEGGVDDIDDAVTGSRGSAAGWLDVGISVICVSSVLFGILLH